jgi:hypothetical protein
MRSMPRPPRRTAATTQPVTGARAKPASPAATAHDTAGSRRPPCAASDSESGGPCEQRRVGTAEPSDGKRRRRHERFPQRQGGGTRFGKGAERLFHGTMPRSRNAGNARAECDGGGPDEAREQRTCATEGRFRAAEARV